MLDKRSFALLDVINNICLNSGYKVIEFKTLVDKMPKGFGSEEDGVKESIVALSEREYISVKYEDEKEICLSPLPKGRLVFEAKTEEELQTKKNKRKYFCSAFFGAVFGGGFITLVFYIVFSLIRGSWS
ncbi:MAG: hypothetical protein KBS91_02885 [Firmicutes bacterium]|nr:hypothetical protein [Candidatus Caballimonas caccae]